ncbi:MAG: protein kinase [Candidatus Sumerlaeia bacterium]|nr:protein kinase [Candidatus Sumerlaeia bacterium]
MSNSIAPELAEVLQELGIISKSGLEEALFEAEQQDVSVWRLLKQQQILTPKQADTLDMCEKGYIPIKVARITLSMELKQNVQKPNPTKTVPADTQETVKQVVKRNETPANSPKQAVSVQSQTPNLDSSSAHVIGQIIGEKKFGNYLKTPLPTASANQPKPDPVALKSPTPLPHSTEPFLDELSPLPLDSTYEEKVVYTPEPESRTEVEAEESNSLGSSSIIEKLRVLDQRSNSPTPVAQEESSLPSMQPSTIQQVFPKPPEFLSNGVEKFTPQRKNRPLSTVAGPLSPSTNSSTQQKSRQKTDLSYLVGRKIGKFQLSTQLGKGSAGTVFLAHHASLNMPVAIKILDPFLAKQHPELIHRFMLEASSAARINHPNVIRVLDCDHVDGFHIIVMEYVDGISLSELIQMNGALSEDRGLKYILSVAEGLEAAYQVGIVHRDIKPANILITKTKQVRIADMGLARAIKDNSMADTAQGVGLGTPQYFPPEQARDAASVDHRSDIYALGVTLYVVLSGELPFKAKTLSELIYQHENEYAIPLNVVNPSITQRTTNLVITMMQKHPSDRYQSYEALIQAIQSCIVECQTKSEDMGSGTSRSSFSMLNKLGNFFNRKT